MSNSKDSRFIKKAYVTPAIVAVIVTILAIIGLLASSHKLPFTADDTVVAETVTTQEESAATQ